MDNNKRTKTTVGIVSENLSMLKNGNYTPEELQTVYMSHIVVMLAALDDDMCELIKTLKSWNPNDDEKCERTGYWKYNPDTDLAECSNCGTHCPHDEIGRIETHYCPGCGAKMERTSS